MKWWPWDAMYYDDNNRAIILFNCNVYPALADNHVVEAIEDIHI